MAFVTDLVALFGPVSAEIVQQRLSQGLPPLRFPSQGAGIVGSLMIGQEWLRREHSPPRIVIVPMGARYQAAIKSGRQPLNGSVGNTSPKDRKLRWLMFEAHIWGDPDPTNANALQDFNACIEMERELLTSLYDQCGGSPNVPHETSEFRQPTDDVRLGRLLVLPFAIGTPVVDLPYTILPYSTATSSGVSVYSNIAIINPATGESTSAGIIIAPPPTIPVSPPVACNTVIRSSVATLITVSCSVVVLTDTTAASFTVTMPASPTDGMTVTVKDDANKWATNPLTIAANTGQTIESPVNLGTFAGSQVLTINSASVEWLYDAAKQIWIVI